MFGQELGVIPREGVESEDGDVILDVHPVIPREGVERLQGVPNSSCDQVIPREGVESVDKAPNLVIKRIGLVIPREGVERRKWSCRPSSTSRPRDPKRGS
jgi:hypothetical protein